MQRRTCVCCKIWGILSNCVLAMNSAAARSQVLENQTKRQQPSATNGCPDFSETYQPVHQLTSGRLSTDLDETDRKPIVVNPPLNVSQSLTNGVRTNDAAVISRRWPMAGSGCLSSTICSDTFDNALSAVLDRMAWAADSLRLSQNVENCLQMCKLIRECADTVVTLKRS